MEGTPKADREWRLFLMARWRGRLRVFSSVFQMLDFALLVFQEQVFDAV